VLALVLANPLADRVVGDAVASADGEVAKLVDLGDELAVGRTVYAPQAQNPATRPLCALPALPRAVALPAGLRDETTTAAKALTLRPLKPKLAAAMGIQRRRAVRADDAQVLEPVVVAYPVHVIEDQCHPTPAPKLALSTYLASSVLEALSKQPPLEVTSAVGRALDEDLVKWASDRPDAQRSDGIGIEMIGGDLPDADPLP